MRRGLFFLNLLLFLGDRVWGFLDGHAVAANLVACPVGLGRALRGLREVVGDRAHQPLDAVPARRITVGVEFLLALHVVDVEDVILVGVAIVHFGVGDTDEFQYLQAGPGFLARAGSAAIGIVACLLH